MASEILELFGGALAICAPIIGLFEWCEKSLRRERAVELWQWLQGGGLEAQLAKWPDLFVKMFDGVFGERHFSFFCFFRSAIMSVIIVVALALFWFSRVEEADRAYFLANELLLPPRQSRGASLGRLETDIQHKQQRLPEEPLMFPHKKRDSIFSVATT